MTAAVTAALPALAAAQISAGPATSADRDAPTAVGAEQMTGRPEREVILERNVEITRGGTRLNADKATYDMIEDEVKATGNVRIWYYGDTYTGDELNLKLDTGQGYVENPTYHLERTNAQGQADRINFLARDRAVVEDGSYSTCEGPDPDWYLKSSKLNLDMGRDIGDATHAVLYFKGVPILASPYISFPLSDQRKSGVLPPTIGVSNKGGLEVQLPYYFNIAPNRDLTLFPRIYSNRGFQLGARARYLGESYSGDTKVEGMLHDRLSGTNRWAVSSLHTQTLAPGLTFSSNINAASDDDYPNSFPHSITTASQRLLLRDVGFSYGSGYWSSALRATNYQVLQDPIVPIGRPYDRLPQFTVNGTRLDYNGFDLSIANDLTRFWHPDLVRGDRLVMNPRVSYPIITPGYFLTPSVSVHATSYSINNMTPGMPSQLNRVLPTLSLDSGLIFERDTGFLGRPVTQTLEPRLFYVYTPFHDQTQFPIFDTALADFNFSQLFSENRFVGSDRVSDANQLTAALVSRFIELSGVERLRLALAQRYYFNDQRVVASSLNVVPGAVPGAVTTGPSGGRSDILLAALGQVSQTLNVETSVQYNQATRGMSRSIYGVRWQPGPMRVLNVQYRRDALAPLELVDVSSQWPIAQRWYAVGRIDYSLRDRKVAEGVFGMEYKADCWIFRVVGQRIPTGTGVATSSLFFQLELSGLARLGSNPLQVLRRNVPGYQILNQP